MGTSEMNIPVQNASGTLVDGARDETQSLVEREGNLVQSKLGYGELFSRFHQYT